MQQESPTNWMDPKGLGLYVNGLEKKINWRGGGRKLWCGATPMDLTIIVSVVPK